MKEAQLDAQFHMAIIEASHNVVMLHMMRSMYQLLRDGVFYNRQVMFKQKDNPQRIVGPNTVLSTMGYNRATLSAPGKLCTHIWILSKKACWISNEQTATKISRD